jgi:D-glycero-D-manno-heptose 1,7-bisphosphate phosphatase
MPVEPKKAVFLDRDGTLNEDPGYLHDASQLKLLPKVVPALNLLRDHGFLLVVVSNQSGVRRGLIREGALEEIHERLNELLGPPRPMIEHFKLCIHRPEDSCDCRKPKPKLLLDAASELGIDLGRSFMVGDKFSDLVAGKSAGCRASVLVRTGEGPVTESRLKPGEADFIADDLEAAALWITGQENPRLRT